MRCTSLSTLTVLMHPSSPLPSPCTCLSSHRSTPVRPFPSLYRLLANPGVRRITSLSKSASFIALFGRLSVTFMLLACSELSASSGKVTIRTKYVSYLLLLSTSSHLPSLWPTQGAHSASSPPPSHTTSACPSCSHQRQSSYRTPNLRILLL